MEPLVFAILSPASSIRQRVRYCIGETPTVSLNFSAKIDRDMPTVQYPDSLEPSGVLRGQTFSRAPAGHICKTWSPFGTTREFDDTDFAMAHNDISGHYKSLKNPVVTRAAED